MEKIYCSVRGTLDFPPEKAHTFNVITQQARDILRLYGYQEIKLPLLEEEGVFKKGVGTSTDIIEKQLFRIEGKDKEIVLRPEGTAQVVRFFLENALHRQGDFWKFSYIGAMFRGERPQKGRLRQFHHIGAEAIGSENIFLDAEMIQLSMRILDEIGISEKELQINTLGCSDDKNAFMRILKKDLTQKKSRLCVDCTRRLVVNPLRILDCKKESCKEVLNDLTVVRDKKRTYLCSTCTDRYQELLALLDATGLPYCCNPYLVRGLDYYTNTVFEITSKHLGSQDAIGAGGRYNDLIQRLGGPSMPAVGFALGIERIMLLKDSELKSPLEVFIANITDATYNKAFEILQRVREAGIVSDIGFSKKSLKAQLKYAQKKGASYVVIVGEEELGEESVVVRDMQKSEQMKVKIAKLLPFLRTKLARE